MQDDRYFLRKAFKILKRNYGCPGNDGISVREIKKNYEYYENIVWKSLKKYNYNFEKQPKCTIITDYLGKKRAIFVYNVTERWVQQFIKLQIESVIDILLSERAYAYRRGKNDVDSYNYILKNNPKFILKIDIKNYFESIDREKIFLFLNRLSINGNLLKIAHESFIHHKKGLPSGHVLSCILSNLYLKNFDSNFPKNYVRYSDDMRFALESWLEIFKTIRFVRKLLKVQGLYLNYKKINIIYKPTIEKIS